ncbi:CGP-CTERM sorting domain-containing protein [Thermococcus profundus]|nr:CGP-CTERM sorting domain-containing protein [Thermococcus profundus]
MRKLSALLLGLILLAPAFGLALGNGDVQDDGNTFVQDYTFHVRLFENGDANITITTTWLAPKSEIRNLVEKYLNYTNGSLSEAIEIYKQNQLQSIQRGLESMGVKIENASIRVFNFDSGDNITMVFNAIGRGVSKYYSHGNFWEVLVDPTRGFSTAFPDTGYPFGIRMHSKFIVDLPTNATLLSYPTGYRKTYNQSSFEVVPDIEGNTVIVESKINLEPYLSNEGYQWLFGDYKGFSITYQTPYKGNETYTKRIMREHVTVEVLKNGTTILTMRDEYVEPMGEILMKKLQILQYGKQKFEQQLLKYHAQMFAQMGAVVEGAGINIKNLNTTDPLVVEARYILSNYTKLVNGTYVLTLNPTMGLKDMVYLRTGSEFNYSFSAEIKLPKGWKFVSYPNSTTRNVHGNTFVMNVKPEGNRLIINATTFLFYGASEEDVNSLLGEVGSVEVKFKKGRSGICGPAFLVGLAIVPLLLRRRR